MGGQGRVISVSWLGNAPSKPIVRPELQERKTCPGGITWSKILHLTLYLSILKALDLFYVKVHFLQVSEL